MSAEKWHRMGRTIFSVEHEPIARLSMKAPKESGDTILAAPKLLAALEAFLGIDDWTDESIAPAHIVEAARAAVAEARGGQPAPETAPAPIVITIEGGAVQNVLDVPPGVSVHIHDYDTDGCDEKDLETDGSGDQYFLITFDSSSGERTKPEPKHITVMVGIDGGIVQGCTADAPNVDVIVLDYDTEGYEDRAEMVPQPDDDEYEYEDVQACVDQYTATHDPDYIAKLHKALRENVGLDEEDDTAAALRGEIARGA